MKRVLAVCIMLVTGLAGTSCSSDSGMDGRSGQPASAEKMAVKKASGSMTGYRLDEPDTLHTLPDILEEASGLTDVSATEVAMVQDELGIIFLFDIASGQITQEVPFAPRGDYEGMTRVDDAMFVLESKGHLFEVQDWLGDKNVIKRWLPLPTSDNEGLCFDPVEDRILLSPKSRWKKGELPKSIRPIFAVDIGSVKLLHEPVFVLNTDDIVKFALEHNLEIPSKAYKKGGEKINLKFKPASLAIHPVTSDIFVISAVNQVLASFNRAGEVTGVHFLDAQTFPKPEGITFLPNSSLVISSEAAKQKPTLAVFKWREGHESALQVASLPLPLE